MDTERNDSQYFKREGRETQKARHEQSPKRSKNRFSESLGMHLSKQSNNDTPMRNETARKVRNRNKNTSGNKTDITENGWGSQ